MRRLPVYLLLDVSGSMRGEPIEAVKQGMYTLIETLRQDPYALETAYISIIVFNNEVQQIVPLTELYKIQLVDIEAKLGTYIGKALRFLSSRLDEEIVKNSYEVKGDWKPIVFLMTDGRSGDSIEKAVRELEMVKFGTIIACATGKEPNTNALHLLTNNVIQLKNMDKESIASFFRWISQSVSSSSVQILDNNHEITVLDELPPLPREIQIV